MLRGLVLFGDDFAYVGLLAAIASARHPCPAPATKLFLPSKFGVVFAAPCKKLSIVARWLLVGLFFVQSFLQFPLCLQIELLVPALWLTGLLPKFIRAADNIYSGRPCHNRCRGLCRPAPCVMAW